MTSPLRHFLVFGAGVHNVDPLVVQAHDVGYDPAGNLCFLLEKVDIKNLSKPTLEPMVTFKQWTFFEEKQTQPEAQTIPTEPLATDTPQASAVPPGATKQ